MPRRPRLFLPGQPQHVVVRGHNRDPVLARADDFRFLYRCLRDAAGRNRLAIHAWVFMHNHLHLLATPGDKQCLPKTMQIVGRRYAQYFNQSYHRSGALWEGRYKCSLVDSDRYLLACYRYIELNPVRAGIVKTPADYPYSSYHANALGRKDAMVTPHPVFAELVSGVVSGVGVDFAHDSRVSTPMRLKSTPTPVNQDGRAVYRRLCEQALDRKTLNEIRRGTEKGLGIGTADFLLKVARLGG